MIKRIYQNITSFKDGDTVVLHKIDSGQENRKRMLELGFAEGGRIKILRGCRKGPLALQIKGTKIALGQGQARKLIVYQE